MGQKSIDGEWREEERETWNQESGIRNQESKRVENKQSRATIKAKQSYCFEALYVLLLKNHADSFSCALSFSSLPLLAVRFAAIVLKR